MKAPAAVAPAPAATVPSGAPGTAAPGTGQSSQGGTPQGASVALPAPMPAPTATQAANLASTAAPTPASQAVVSVNQATASAVAPAAPPAALPATQPSGLGPVLSLDPPMVNQATGGTIRTQCDSEWRAERVQRAGADPLRSECDAVCECFQRRGALHGWRGGGAGASGRCGEGRADVIADAAAGFKRHLASGGRCLR